MLELTCHKHLKVATMLRCVLVFDYTNDIIYAKYNDEFVNHMVKYAEEHNYPPDEVMQNEKLNTNILVQLFAPMVTSQKTMNCQFGNSYTSVQCENNINFTFEEYMGYLFIHISQDDIAAMKRFLNGCVTIMRYFCGPNVLLVKFHLNISKMVTNVIDSWARLQDTEQAVLVEAIEQLLVNPHLSSTTIQALQEANERMQAQAECPRVHALLLVQNKFLALYSSRTAKELAPPDVLFVNLLCGFVNNNVQRAEECSSLTYCDHIDDHTFSFKLLLTGSEFTSKCAPHVVHITSIFDGINLVFLLENGNSVISSSLYEAFHCLSVIKVVQVQRDIETLKPAFENLDFAMKKLNEGLKKQKLVKVEAVYKQLIKKWDFIRRKYLENIKNNSADALLRAEASLTSLLDLLQELLNLTAFDDELLKTSQKYVAEISQIVESKLANFNDFLQVKVMKNFTLGSSYSLTMNKYVEEFPGLVHFIYVDRTTHRVTTPTLDFTSEETISLTKRKIWSMIEFSRNHLQEGNLSVMWKDTTFNFAYFLWFEDNSGAALKPTIFPTNASKALPQPGILCGDFYQKLKEACFPKMQPSKIRCYELFCIHLGLVTASCVLEHTRRLAATIWELKGHPGHPLDLL